ncbi:50S ribosomal protein L11 methyltransferase [Bacillus paralicheniformis]|uniref:50S ribosomal protein L11 methyltransferase n=1 Tax=Bacillus paralicheniformis TaxID=1648923 RepID=UPI00295EA94B|nr:50S ribosomal protein L11 methyltransferase [Bacillus paralicheniformis]
MKISPSLMCMDLLKFKEQIEFIDSHAGPAHPGGGGTRGDRRRRGHRAGALADPAVARQPARAAAAGSAGHSGRPAGGLPDDIDGRGGQPGRAAGDRAAAVRARRPAGYPVRHHRRWRGRHAATGHADPGNLGRPRGGAGGTEEPRRGARTVAEETAEMSAYVNVGACEIEESQTEDVDWVNNWKKYFHQFYVDDILIIPSWEDVKPSDEDKMVIHIDPGTAFGTGMHETTQLCIRQIRKYTTETTKILDVGCGSGILGMLALKFGAEHSVGTDLDPCAIDATYEG